MGTTEQDGTFFTIEAINFLATFFSSTRTRCEMWIFHPHSSKQSPTDHSCYFLVTRTSSRQLVTVLHFGMESLPVYREVTSRKFFGIPVQSLNFARPRDPVTSSNLRALLIWAALHRGTGGTSKRVHRLARSRYSLGCFRR